MGLLDDLLGGPKQQQDLQNFSDRYSQGPPDQGYSAQEAQQYYQQVAPQLPPQQYQAAAQQAFSQLSPQQLEALAQQLHQAAMQQGVSVPGMNSGQYQQYRDPGQLAQVATQMHKDQPGLLGQLLGGGGGMNPLAKVALGGIAAMAVKNLMACKL